jgi:ABC-type lipoprotein export system ATPase subunit
MKPKILILEDPLDQFEIEEAKQIINFLTDKNRPWTLIVSSMNNRWLDKCTNTITLKEGKTV